MQRISPSHLQPRFSAKNRRQKPVHPARRAKTAENFPQNSASAQTVPVPFQKRIRDRRARSSSTMFPQTAPGGQRRNERAKNVNLAVYHFDFPAAG